MADILKSKLLFPIAPSEKGPVFVLLGHGGPNWYPNTLYRACAHQGRWQPYFLPQGRQEARKGEQLISPRGSAEMGSGYLRKYTSVIFGANPMEPVLLQSISQYRGASPLLAIDSIDSNSTSNIELANPSNERLSAGEWIEAKVEPVG